MSGCGRRARGTTICRTANGDGFFSSWPCARACLRWQGGAGGWGASSRWPTRRAGSGRRPPPSTWPRHWRSRDVRRCSPTAIERLHVLPATRDLVGAEVELIGVKSREHRLHEGLAVVRSRYELILIDCPPSLNLLTVNALRTADTVLIPLQCEYYALEGLTALLDTVGRVRDTLHPGLALEGLVLTMYDGRNSLEGEARMQRVPD